MKMKKPIIKMVEEFDAMFSDSELSLSDKTTLCFIERNSSNEYAMNNWLIISDKPLNEFNVLKSIGKIKLKGKGTLLAVLGTNNLYLSESGWYSSATFQSGKPSFYSLDLDGKQIWENNLEGAHAIDILEISDKELFVISDNGPISSFLWKLDKNGNKIWKIALGRILVTPLIDEDNNIYIKHDSKISKINSTGNILWDIDLGSDRGQFWENIIYNNGKMFYGFTFEKQHCIIEFDVDGNILCKHALPEYMQYPALDNDSALIYCISGDNKIVAFSTHDFSIKYQVQLGIEFCSNKPIIYQDYIVLCNDKKVYIFSKDLTPISTSRLKGFVLGECITTRNTLQILVTDDEAWNQGKSEICYSRIYELEG